MLKFNYNSGLWTLVLCLIFYQNLKCQTYLTNDTLRVKEFSVGFTPALSVLIGAGNRLSYSAFHVTGRRYLKNNLAVKFSAEIYPFPRYNGLEGYVLYDRTVDTLNFFRVDQTTQRPKVQLNFGIEKLYKFNRFIHGYSLDLGVFSQTVNAKQLYYWYPYHMNLTSSNKLKYRNSNPADAGLINNVVDSLTYSYTKRNTGVSIKLFYTIRHKISTHYYLNASFGPAVWMSIGTYTSSSGAKAPGKNLRVYDFDGALFFTDISLAYRF